ncbi:MAG: methyl-accepting chemotaxis protein [Chloroflexi bacterium]|nr:methyl-accepting chemotaxis protein [Chloroflexota bacterium]
MSQQKYVRKRYFLPESSQPRLLLGIELIFLILLLVSGAIFYVIANRDLTTTYYQAHLQIKNLRDILLPVLIAINLVGLVLGAILSLFFTHRIAGPLYRLCRVMKEVGQGNLDQVIHFRKSDELREVETAADEMLAGLNARIADLQASAGRLHDHLDALGGVGSAPREEAEHLLQVLSEFRVKGGLKGDGS